jgi:hypothetical protein
MEFYCAPCQKVTDSYNNLCPRAFDWFSRANGEKIWRIRKLNEYAYQYLTDEEYMKLSSGTSLILSEVRSWDGFDSTTLTGIDSSGKRTSIFN